MKKRILLIPLVLLLAMSMVTFGCPPVQEVPDPVVVPPVEVFEWSIQSLYPAGVLGYEVFVEWTETVKELTGGQLIITPFPGCAVVPTLEMFENVVAGVLDGMHGTPAYWGGKDAGFSLAVIPFAFTESWQLDIWLHELGGEEMFRALYAEHGLHLVGTHLWGPESLVSTVPIHRIEDFEGLTMRSPGGIMADVFDRFGAALVVMPLGEVYTALEKGIIDMTDWGTPSGNFDVGVHEVATYFIYPVAHCNPVLDIVVRPEAWNELPAEIQSILETSIREKFWVKASRLLLEDKVAVETMIGLGNVAIAWDQAEVARMAAIATEVWDDWAAKTPAAYQIIQSKLSFMRELGLIE